MRKHAVIAAFAIVSALASHQPAAARGQPIITCDMRGCRPDQAPAARAGAATHERAARRQHRRSRHLEITRAEPRQHDAGAGIVRSGKTGATARVALRYVGVFQAYIDDLEAHGAAVYYMGGIRRGHCSNASQHPCGSALDVCQDWRGHVSAARDCHLPRPQEMAAIAARHGLEEGGIWCHSDYGHAQAQPSAGRCPTRRYATGSWGTGTTRVVSARRHHHHHRFKLARR